MVSSQWDPCLAENQKIIGTDPRFYDDDDPYYFPDAMADRTIEWLHGVRAQDAHKPFFVYFSTGCSHAPHHVAKEWADKYKGQFDQGWDKLREETFARQKDLGVVPPDAELTPRDAAFPAWDDLSDELKAFYARQMEVYAGYSENADHNVGRVIDAIDELGELDNTLILWIWGDNGASMEGTLTGSFNELTMQNGIPLTDEMQLQLAELYGGLDEVGRGDHGPALRRGVGVGREHAVPVGQAGRVAPRRNPQPVRRPLAGPHRRRRAGCAPSSPTSSTSRPRSSTSPGSRSPTRRRHRAGADARLDVRAVAHRRAAPEHRTQQYFETVGNRGMYKDGWWLAMKTERIPWVLTPDALAPYAPGVWDPDADPAELYYLPDDFTQAHDLAAEHPEKVAGAQGAVLGGGRALQGPAAARRALDLLRHPAADPRGDDLRVPRRRAERDAGHDPARSTTARTRSPRTSSSPRAGPRA